MIWGHWLPIIIFRRYAFIVYMVFGVMVTIWSINKICIMCIKNRWHMLYSIMNYKFILSLNRCKPFGQRISVRNQQQLFLKLCTPYINYKLELSSQPIILLANVALPDTASSDEFCYFTFWHNSVMEIQPAIFPLDRTVHIESIT